MTPLKRRLVLAGLVPALCLLTSCGGDDDDTGGDTPDQVLSAAKKALDDTPGVHLVLDTPKLPSGVEGLVKAEGLGTHQPAFDGTVEIFLGGIMLPPIPVISVDGVVHAQIPFTSKFTPIDPSEYKAPDPAALMSRNHGISSWLTEAEGVKKGKSVRDGSDVLTSYEGTLPGSSVAPVLPSVDESNDFAAVFTVAKDGKLRSAKLTGEFYKGQPELAYTVKFDDYGSDKDVKAP